MIKPTITLRPENRFFDLFPNGLVPVTTFVPGVAELEAGEKVSPQLVYMLDVERLTSEQMEAVAGRVAELFGARVSEVVGTPAIPLELLL